MTQQPSQEPQSDDRIFNDPVLSQTAAEDPLLRLVRDHWRQLLLICAAIAAGYFGNRAFQQTYENSMKRSAHLYLTLRNHLAENENLRKEVEEARLSSDATEESASKEDQTAPKQDGSKAEEVAASNAERVAELQQELDQSNTRVREILNALSDSRAPYNEIAGIYQDVFAAKAGAEQAPGTISANDWMQIEAQSPQRFFSELAELHVVGTLLDVNGQQAAALSRLDRLAKNGEFFAVIAALRYARVAQSEKEIEQAVLAFESVSSRFPEQADLVDAELDRLQ